MKDTRNIKGIKVLDSEYIHGSDGCKRAILMDDGTVQVGWGLALPINQSEIDNHSYAVTSYKNEAEYIVSD